MPADDEASNQQHAAEWNRPMRDLYSQIVRHLHGQPGLHRQGTGPVERAQRTRRNGTVRCAIYTRKSSEEGLEQEFYSLQAQREACEAFITSQRHEGWVCLPDRYDDGGFTGGNMDRPALARLLADIAAGKIQADSSAK